MGRLLATRSAVFIHDNTKNSQYILKEAKGLPHLQKGETFEISVPAAKKERSYFSMETVEGLEEVIRDEEKGKFRLFNLRTMDHHHGYLLLGPKANKQQFYKHELEFVESLCLISTAALVNSELFEELKKTHRNLDRRIHELNTLFDLSKEFNVLTDRKQIARIFKLTLLGQLFIRTFFLVYQNEDTPRLITYNGLNTSLSQQEVEKIFNEVRSDIFVSDWQEEEKHPWVTENGISALIPISIQNTQVALIGVGQRVNREDFNENDINFLKSIANLAVISIHKKFFLEEKIDMNRYIHIRHHITGKSERDLDSYIVLSGRTDRHGENGRGTLHCKVDTARPAVGPRSRNSRNRSCCQNRLIQRGGRRLF